MRKAFHGGGVRCSQSSRAAASISTTSSSSPSINSKTSSRITSCNQAISSLTARLRDYRPQAIVILLLSIKSMSHKVAMREADLSASNPYAIPYPGFGNQARFQVAMAEIIPNLPTASAPTRKEQSR